jgi:phosphoglycerate dehydrogenase-like enzyme
MSRIVAVLPLAAKVIVEQRLPDWIEPHYFSSPEELVELAPRAEIGWFDNTYVPSMVEAARLGEGLRWIVTAGAGVDFFPLDLLMQRGVTITKGTGVNAAPIAEYLVMGMLAIAKGYREVVRAQDRHEWLWNSPGTRQLAGGKALIVGFGAIGQELARRLRAFDMEVTGVTRSGGEGTLRPDEWRKRLPEYDWIILAAPSTGETRHMIGRAELAVMKQDAVLVNVARGTLVDQDALAEALRDKRIAAALLDVTDPEPLDGDHPLWTLENAHITMHLSGRAQQSMFAGVAERFLANCEVFRRGEVPQPAYDPARGY